MPRRPMKTSTKEVADDFREVVVKGDKIRVYLGEEKNARITSYTAGAHTGQFTEDGLPILKQESDTGIVYDFYLNESKVKFSKRIDYQLVVSRKIN